MLYLLHIKRTNAFVLVIGFLTLGIPARSSKGKELDTMHAALMQKLRRAALTDSIQVLGFFFLLEKYVFAKVARLQNHQIVYPTIPVVSTV